MKSVIYKIESPSGNCYVGSTRCWPDRMWRHRSDLRHKNHCCFKLQRASNKYGLDSLVFSILEEVEDEFKLIDKEQEWMDKLNPKYNSSLIAKAPSQDPRVSKNISKSLTGRKLSQETKNKISNSTKGKIGKPHTDESKEKIRSKLIGRVMPEYQRQKLSKSKSMAIKCVETGQIFDSMKEAGEHLGCHSNVISLICKGKRKTCHGYSFILLNNA